MGAAVAVTPATFRACSVEADTFQSNAAQLWSSISILSPMNRLIHQYVVSQFLMCLAKFAADFISPFLSYYSCDPLIFRSHLSPGAPLASPDVHTLRCLVMFDLDTSFPHFSQTLLESSAALARLQLFSWLLFAASVSTTKPHLSQLNLFLSSFLQCILFCWSVNSALLLRGSATLRYFFYCWT